jgi:AraC family transcriptional regulator
VVRSFFSCRNELLPAVQRLQAALLDRPPGEPADGPRWLPYVIEKFPWLQPMPLRNAAVIGGVHETHFSRAFRRHVGMTANAYRLRVRIRHASKLLLTTNASVARIALACGFSDQSHLTRAFSQELGLGPAGYRRVFTR